MLQSTQPPTIEAILTILINNLAEQKQTVLLALDDYHAAHANTVYLLITTADRGCNACPCRPHL